MAAGEEDEEAGNEDAETEDCSGVDAAG